MLVRQLPAQSRTVRALQPKAEWDQKDHLLAMIVDLLAGANWQRGTDPRKPGPRPKPLPRPGEDLADDRHGTAVPLNELRRRLHPELFDQDGEEVNDGG